MIERLKAGLLIAATAALLVPFVPQFAAAQEPGGRFRVIIPDVVPTDDSPARFGDRVSGYLRDMIELDTHVAMPKRQIEAHAGEYNLSYDDLDCITARQLAAQIGSQIVMCGDYHAMGDEYRVEVAFYTVPGGEALEVEPFMASREGWFEAAEHLSHSFTQIVERVGILSNCQREYGSSNWGEAVNYCSRALEHAPESYQVRFTLARAYFELEQWEEAVTHFEALLERDPNDEAVLDNIAYVAAQQGETEKARDYYLRYLQQNPENVTVRMRVAYDLAQAGDSYGAMSLLEEGLEQEPENVDLHESFGANAFRAAVALQQEEELLGGASQDAGVSPEVAELFRTAINSLEFVVEAQGAETRPSYVENIMRAYRQLDEPEEAVRIGRRATELFPENARIQSQLANAHNAAGDVDSALEALERAIAIDPDVPQARIRQGTFLLEAGRIDEAVDAFKAAAEAGEAPADQLSGMIFQHGYQNYVATGADYQEGIRLIEAAKTFDVSSEFMEQLHFFHGWSVTQRAEAVQEPNTLQSARAALPLFQEARQLLQAGRGHIDRTASLNYQELMDYVGQYINVQEAIIAREGRR